MRPKGNTEETLATPPAPPLAASTLLGKACRQDPGRLCSLYTLHSNQHDLVDATVPSPTDTIATHAVATTWAIHGIAHDRSRMSESAVQG